MQFIDRALERNSPRKSREEIQKQVEEEHHAIGRGIASRFSRGNVNIKRGSYLTERDLKDRAKK